MFGKIGGRLSGERRIGGARALSLLAMTDGARLQPARRVALVIQTQGVGGRRDTGRNRQCRVERGHRAAFAGIEPFGDPPHLSVITAPVGEGVELPLEIARVQSSKPRRARAISAPIEPVTGDAGVDRTGLRAAQRDHPAVGCETVERRCLGGATSREQARGDQVKKFAHGAATAGFPARFRPAVVVPLLLLAAACQPPPDERHSMPMADAANGKAVIARAGCGSCHTIAGVRWPQGKVGPRLDGLAGRALIAGKLPNRPDVLAEFIRNAPALVPGSGMPAMPITRSEARDIAAFLYQQENP